MQTYMRALFLALWLIALCQCDLSSREPSPNASSTGKRRTLLNASYDPTREFFREINSVFEKRWFDQHHESITVRQSHGGSGKQARSVIEGLPADVVTLALSFDIDQISKKSALLPENWAQRLPYRSAPYTSTIVFLVRKGIQHQIRDWDDLLAPGISVVTPSPKSSGGARWNYLAALAYARRKCKGDEACAEEFVRRLYAQVPVLDTGARAATTTFAQRGIGDVLLSWENEAFLALELFGKERFEIVVPSVSVLAEPPVALIDSVVDARGTRDLAQAYLEFLYTDEGQDIVAKHYFRPQNPEIMKRHAGAFPSLERVTIDEEFGGWDTVQKLHFKDGGVFDKIYEKGR